MFNVYIFIYVSITLLLSSKKSTKYSTVIMQLTLPATLVPNGKQTRLRTTDEWVYQMSGLEYRPLLRRVLIALGCRSA